jgi:hypothetical protein
MIRKHYRQPVKACHREPVPIGDVVAPLHGRVVLRRRREVEDQTKVEPEDDLTGSWGSVRSASQICGVPEKQVLTGILSGSIRTERRSGCLLVRLDDVAKLAGGSST